MKNYFKTNIFNQFIFLFLLSLTIGKTAQAAEKISPNNTGHWIVDGFKIGIDIKCNISRSNLIPEKYCAKPSVVIDKFYDTEKDSTSPNNQYFKLVVGDIAFGDTWIFEANNDSHKKAPIFHLTAGMAQSEQLFSLLTSGADDPPIKFMTKSRSDSPIKSKLIILSNFKSYNEEQISKINYRYDKEESDARKGLILSLVALTAFSGMIFMIIRLIIRKTRRKIYDAKQHFEARRVSRVAEDEVIREVTRKSVQQAENQSVEALRNQIKAALDAGNTETAEKLLKIMKESTKK